MTRVLPLPAPAKISTGPSIVSTASRCCGFSCSRKDNAEVAPESLIQFYRGIAAGGIARADFPVRRIQNETLTRGTRSRGANFGRKARRHLRSFRGVEPGSAPCMAASCWERGALVRPREEPYESEDFLGFRRAADGNRAGGRRPARGARRRGDSRAGLQGVGSDPPWQSHGVSRGRGEKLPNRRVHHAG